MTLKRMATESFEISEAVPVDKTWTPDVWNLHQDRCEKLKMFHLSNCFQTMEKQEISVAIVGLRSFRIVTNFYHAP